MTATEQIANWSSTLTYDNLPPPVRQAALCSFYNWAGCTIGGITHPATTIAHDSLAAFFGGSTSTLLGYASSFSSGPGPADTPRTPDTITGIDARGKIRGKIDAQHAALLNGIASHVHDYDDTHLDTIIHPTGPVAAAVLAVAEWQSQAQEGHPISGQDVITALVAGIEVECKCGLGVWPTHYDIGWHITSTTGSIGAAVGVSNLLRLNEVQTAHAIGIAATQVTGLREMFGSHTKSFHPGRAAQNGLLAAVLASKGYTSSLSALEAKRGWVNVTSDNEVTKLDDLVKSLGTGVWEIEKNSFKPFPCGIVIHPVIDACIQLHDTGKCTNVDSIRSVEVTVHPLVLELTGKSEPKDGLEAKFSVYHGAAVGLLLGKATPAQYEDVVVLDETVINLRRKVRAVVDESCRPDECWVTVQVPSGTLEVHVEHAVGSVHAPMSDAQLTHKFIDQCVPVLGLEGAKRASDWCWRLETVADIRDVSCLA